MLSFAAKTCYNRSCFRGNLPGRFSYASTVERKLHRLCRLSLSPFSLLCSSPARESNTSVARATTSRPSAATASMSITPARPATIISICSVNSRFPLDFERKISYTKSVISRRCGGIGRRPGFKIPCPQGRAGSTPATGTKQMKSEPSFPNWKWVRIFFLSFNHKGITH